MSAEQCEVLRELSSNFAYQALIAVKCSLCVMAVYGISYQWHKQGVRFLVHDNTKVVFKFYYALNLFVSASFAESYIFELIRLRFDCYVVNFRTVLLSKGMGISAIIAAQYVIMIISFERVYSALFPAHFEKHSDKRLAFVLSLTTVIVFIYTAFSLFVYCTDIYLNFIRKPTASNPSLSISYQRSENRRVLLIILPLEITETIMYFAATFAFIIQDDKMPMQRALYLELLTLPIFSPLILVIIIELRVARRH
ncbi:hypothetical protein PENTCL1PPCAC_15817, partial [Pristionchus entomophagus]